MKEEKFDLPNSSEPPPKWFRYLFNRYTLILFILACVLLSPLAYRCYLLSRLPYIDEPFDIEEYGNAVTIPEENAVILYKEAIKHDVPFGIPLFDTENEKHAHVYDGGYMSFDWENASKVQKQQICDWLDKSKHQLKIIKKASEKKYHQSIPPREQDTEIDSFDSSIVWGFGKVAVLNAGRLQNEGNLGEALDWYLAAYRISIQLSQNLNKFDKMKSLGLNSVLVTKVLKWSQHSGITSAELKQFIQRLEENFKKTELPSRYLNSQYTERLDSLNDSNFDPEFVVDEQTWHRKLYLFFNGEPDLSIQLLRYQVENLLPEIDKPRFERSRQISRFNLYDNQSLGFDVSKLARLFEKSLSRNIIDLDFEPFLIAFDYEKARHEIMMLTLKTQLYKRVVGHFPDSFNDLIDYGYLDKVPFDPLQNKKRELVFRNNGEQIAIYGVGNNGIDDGGFDSVGFSDRDFSDYGYVFNIE